MVRRTPQFISLWIILFSFRIPAEIMSKPGCPTGTSRCGTSRCGTSCVDTTSNLNCGACGIVCSEAKVCSNQKCACPAGMKVAGGKCVLPPSPTPQTFEVPILEIPSPLRPKECCVCSYQQFPDCLGKSEKQCLSTPEKGIYCEFFNGRCTSLMEKKCSQWLKAAPQAGWCDVSAIKEVKANQTDMNMTAGLKHCTAIRLGFIEHSESYGCAKLANRVVVCLTENTHCSKLAVEHLGCRSFSDIALARIYMDSIASVVASAGCSVAVRANQSIAMGELSCRTGYEFDISVDGLVTEKPDACHADGSSLDCYQELAGESSLCSTPRGITSQTCCCGFLSCRWRLRTNSCL